MKKSISYVVVVLILILSSCTKDNNISNNSENINLVDNINNDLESVTIIDSIGEEVTFNTVPKNVVVIGSSLTDIWLLAGGEITGTSSDSFTRIENLSEDILNIGTYKEPNIEKILKLKPDLVILSPNIVEQRNLEEILKSSNIKVVFADINNFNDYLKVLETFTYITKNADYYSKNGLDVLNKIEKYIESSKDMEHKNALVVRTSTAMLKPLQKDNFAIDIITDMGISNITDKNNIISENLSIEEILKEDPYYIFLIIMGSNEEASMSKINTYILENPAWSTLTAVKEDRFIILPRELFHYKPNEKWGEAYEFIYNTREKQE